MENYQELIILLIGAGFGYLSPIIVKLLKGLLDSLEAKVEESNTKIDDVLYARLRSIVEEVFTEKEEAVRQQQQDKKEDV